jgi:hypothetical protein
MTEIVSSSEEKTQGNNKELLKIEANQKSQTINFGSIVQSLFSGANTNVETSKFSIEKTEDGIRVDIAFTGDIKTGKKNGT